MQKIQITKLVFSSNQSLRTIKPGIYSRDFFTQEELDYIEKVNAFKILEEKTSVKPKRKTTTKPNLTEEENN